MQGQLSNLPLPTTDTRLVESIGVWEATTNRPSTLRQAQGERIVHGRLESPGCLPPPLCDVPQLAVPAVDADALQGVEVRGDEASVDEGDLVVILHMEIVQLFH